ncbi:MAG: lysophospholipid acyltransferase family protein [Betaproteobacteria bacterium]
MNQFIRGWMFFVRWISRWPLGLLHALGGLLGWLVWLCSPTYRRRLRENAALAGVDARAQRQSIAESGRMVAELPWLWLRADEAQLLRLVEWVGAEPLDQAIAERRPLVILTPHMGAFEVSARAYVTRYGARQPLTVLYRPARQKALREFQESARQKPMMATALAGLAGVRQMLRALKRHETVGLLPDQVPPRGQGVWAPFFGQTAYTMTLAVRLVQQTDANCFVLRTERLPHGRGYRVHVSVLGSALIAGTDLAAQTAAAVVMNKTMEKVILQEPGQYLWGYNRYKQPRETEAAPSANPNKNEITE